MFRRLALFLRRGLFVVGVGVLVWWPVSFILFVRADWAFGLISSGSGSAMVLVQPDPGATLQILPYSTYHQWWPSSHSWFYAIVPWFDTYAGPGQYVFLTPLWLLAFACLAWPTTSFFLRRRRRGRGFAVEPMKEEG